MFWVEKRIFLYRFDYHSKLPWKYSEKKANHLLSLGKDFIAIISFQKGQQWIFPRKLALKFFTQKKIFERKIKVPLSD